MALLSNINNLFSVDSTGEIKFNDKAGTAGYVLVSAGTGGPPVWTDRDTGGVRGTGTENKVVRWNVATVTGVPQTIGDGPITFSGSAADATSTFGGDVTSSGNIGSTIDANTTNQLSVTNSNSGSSATARVLIVSDSGNMQLKAVSSTNTTYGAGDVGVINCDTMSGGLRFAHNDQVKYTLAFDGENTWTGGGTFGGNVITDGIYKITTAPDGNILELDQGGRSMDIGVYFSSNSTDSEWQFKTSTGNVNGTTTNALVVKPLLATFAGDVTANGNVTIANSSPDLYLFPTGNFHSFRVSAQENVANTFEITPSTTAGGSTYSNPALSISHTGNSTFAGDVGIGISPNQNFHIFKSDATALIQASNTSGTAQLQFIPRDASNVASLQSIKGVDSSLTFLTGGNSGNSYVPTERMRIDSSGTTKITTDGTEQLILHRSDSSIFENNTIGTIKVTADDPTANVVGGQIQFTGGGTWSSNNYPTNIIFSNDNTGTLTERMRILANGNVLIGTTGATTTRLKVVQNANSEWASQITNIGTNAYGLAVDTSANTGIFSLAVYTNTGTGMFVRNEGKVGIGTISPTSKLDISDAVDRVMNSSGEGQFEITGNGYTFGIAMGATTTALYHNSSARSLTLGTDETPRLTIEGGGNVGIGTESPRGKLQINGNGNAWNDAPSVRLWDTTNGKGWLVGNVNNYTSGDFYIRTMPSISGDPGGAQQEFTIKHATGYLGIGTTSPGYKLDIIGDSGIYTNLTVGYQSVTSSTTNYEYKLRVQGKNNYSTSGNWYGTYGQILLHADTNMTGSAKRFLITNALDNNKFAIVRSADGNTDPVVNSTGTGVNSGTADFVINNSGNIGIGQPSPSYKLHVTGSILASADVIAYSDKKLKKNIKTLDGSKVYKMRGVSFIKDNKKGSGVIAQELEKVAPELVQNNSEYKGVAYGNLSGYLIEAIKELKAEIEELKFNKCNCNK